ncbi:MAG: FxDxF family PEP-CTERM protein [Oscillospiraceae bacterium]
MKKSLLLLSLLALPGFAQADTNLIQNGGFESYTVTSGNFVHIDSGSIPANTYWEPIAGAPTEFLEIRNNLAGIAQEGVNFAELDSVGTSGIQQTFNLASASIGSLSWFYSPRPGNTEVGVNDYEVLLNGSNIYTLTSSIGNATGNTIWTEFTVNNLNLLAGDNTLTFKSIFVPGVVVHEGANIDNISLTATSVAAVPEPETYGMMLAGLAMLGFVSRRRRGA